MKIVYNEYTKKINLDKKILNQCDFINKIQTYANQFSTLIS